MDKGTGCLFGWWWVLCCFDWLRYLSVDGVDWIVSLICHAAPMPSDVLYFLVSRDQLPLLLIGVACLLLVRSMLLCRCLCLRSEASSSNKHILLAILLSTASSLTYSFASRL